MLSAGVLSCKPIEVRPEVIEASLNALQVEAKVHVVTYDLIEVTTSFTIGQAADAAAQELRALLASQLKCADISLDDRTLTIEFGVLDERCFYRGHTYGGIARVRIVSAARGELEVQHAWEDLSDGDITVSGSADVTWSKAGGSRRVVHDLTWRDTDEGEARFTSSGDRTERFIDPEQGLSAGIVIDGERTWSADLDTWNLDIESVEVRLQDPIPQDGHYVLSTPVYGEVGMYFDRTSPTSILVSLENDGRVSMIEVRTPDE